MKVEKLILERIGTETSFYTDPSLGIHPVMTGTPVAVGKFQHLGLEQGEHVMIENAVPRSAKTGSKISPVLKRCILKVSDIKKVA